MIRRKITILMMSVLIGTSLLGVVLGTLSWFDSYLSVPDNKIVGQVEGAYFAYGDGSFEHPYGITKYRHMYNLSWLQYLGRFKDKQCYFELGDNVDMGGIAIPPIGTTQYPFIGNFNGKDHVVSNFSISNDFADLKLHPTNQAEIDASVVKIVGIFGVVGDYSPNSNTATYSSQINEIKNAGFANFTVKTVATDTLIGMLAGYADATISNVAVDSGTINIKNSTTVLNPLLTNRISDYGIVGYTTKEQNISKFSSTIYGVNAIEVDQFSVDDQGLANAGWGGSIDMKKIYDNLKTVWNDSSRAGRVLSREETHDEYGHLLKLEETTDSSANVDFPYAEYEGRFSTTGAGSHFYANNQVTERNAETNQDEVTSSFGFVKNTTGETGQFIDITGDRDILMNPASGLTSDVLTDIQDGYLIKFEENGNPHYLSLNGTAVTDKTSTRYATFWIYDESNGTIRSLTEDEYYLSCDASGNLSGTVAQNNTWHYLKTIGYYTNVGGNNYALGFNGTNWVTTAYQSDGYYIICEGITYQDQVGSAYLSHNLDTVFNPINPSANNNIRWYVNANGYYGTRADSNRFLGATQSQGSPWSFLGERVYEYTLAANATDNFAFRMVVEEGSNCLSFTADYHRPNILSTWTPAKYYLNYANNQFVCSRDTRQNLSILDAVTYTNNINCEKITTEYVSEGKHALVKPAFVHSHHTFWPLINQGDSTGTDVTDDRFGVPAEQNTGYIVGGANYAGDPYGDIRFAAFPDQHTYMEKIILGYERPVTVSSLRNSYSPGADSFSHVYTIDASNRKDILSAYPTERERKIKYPKFAKASKRLIKNLKDTYRGNGSGNIHGLHFMDARITYGLSAGRDRSAYADKAIINKTSFSHYELPTSCIDFNLKDPGRITFFAGTYFWGDTAGDKTNNCFFSLHQVQRYTEEEAAGNPNADIRPNGIKSIKEIKLVLEKGHADDLEYAFQYTDGTYSDNYNPAFSYTIAFDTEWIHQHETCIESTENKKYLLDAVYYFEIPVGAGEYALGSVQGGDGGYLMYLDIGANAAIMNRSIFGEEIITIQSDYKCPLGLAFVPANEMSTKLVAKTVDPLQSEFFSIYAGSSGDITLTQTSSSVADLTVSTAGLSIKAAYIYDKITMHDPGGNNMESTPLLKTTTTIEETLYMDYNEVMEETYQTAIITTTVSTQSDSENAPTVQAPTKSYWQIAPDSSVKNTDASSIIFFETESGDAINVADAETQSAKDNITALQFTFETANGIAATVTLSAKTTLNAQELYYEFSGYDVFVVDQNGNSLSVTGVGVTIGTSGGIQTITLTVDGITYVFRFNPSA